MIRNIHQITIKNNIHFEGIGVHTGERVSVNIQPADEDTGIIFIKNGLEIKASIDNIVDTTRSTTIGKEGESVSTIEHLMAAFHGIGIDNALVVCKGDEVPILDGSSKFFVRKLLKAGLHVLDADRLVFKLIKPVEIVLGDRKIIGLPARELKVKYTINYPTVGLLETYRYIHSFLNFLKIMNAKTFVVSLRDLKEKTWEKV